MKKIFFVLSVAAVSVYLSCGGGSQVKQAPAKVEPAQPVVQAEAPSVQAPSVDADLWVRSSNEQLERIPVGGFGYKSSEVPPQSWDAWATTSAPVVSGVLSKLPAGYVLQVTGHTDASGPESAEGQKPGNIRISTARAKAVYDSLKKKGISSPKMTYKGVGSSEPIAGVDPRDAAQRRVTFRVVKAK